MKVLTVQGGLCLKSSTLRPYMKQYTVISDSQVHNPGGCEVLLCAAWWTQTQTQTNVGLNEAGCIARKVGNGRG